MCHESDRGAANFGGSALSVGESSILIGTEAARSDISPTDIVLLIGLESLLEVSSRDRIALRHVLQRFIDLEQVSVLYTALTLGVGCCISREGTSWRSVDAGTWRRRCLWSSSSGAGVLNLVFSAFSEAGDALPDIFVDLTWNLNCESMTVFLDRYLLSSL